MNIIKSILYFTLALFIVSSTASAVAPTINYAFPTSDPSDIAGATREFSVITDDLVTNVTWYINGTQVQLNTSGDYLRYWNTSAVANANAWNVTAVVIGTDGNASNTTTKMWNWTVIALAPPNISSYLPASDPSDLNTSSRSFNATANQTGTFVWTINGTTYQTDTATTESTFTNSTTPYNASAYNVTVTFTSTNGTDSQMWNWTRTIAPAITSYAPTTLTVTDTDSTISRTWNVTADRAANYTWYMDETSVQTNTSDLVLANYTNTSATLGTHNVSVVVNNTNGTGNMITWSWVVPTSTVSSATLVTNTSDNGRTRTGMNLSHVNVSFSDTGNISTINLTFPSGFTFAGVIAGDISSSIGTCTVTLTSTVISCAGSTPLNNSAQHLNITGNLTMHGTAGNYNIGISTNKNSDVTNVTVYVRNGSKPYLISMNNSNFVIGTETYGTFTTTIPLTGSGSTNITVCAPYITGQTNITAGYGATNASKVQVVNATCGSTNRTVYITTDSSVTNPTIVLSNVNELESSNLPAALIALATTFTAIIVRYVYRRRRRS